MRAWLLVSAVTLSGCHVPQSAEAAGDGRATALAGPVLQSPVRSRTEILGAMRSLERLAALSDGCKLNERIVIGIITRVGAALFVDGLQLKVTAADRARALNAGAEDASRERSSGRAPGCVQVGAEMVAMARQFAVTTSRTRVQGNNPG